MSLLDHETTPVAARLQVKPYGRFANRHLQSRHLECPNAHAANAVWRRHNAAPAWRNKWFVRYRLATTKAVGNPKSMQDLWCFVRLCMGRRCTWAGVMCHHAPTLGGALVNIGSDNDSFLRAIGGQQGNAFNHVVHGTGE